MIFAFLQDSYMYRPFTLLQSNRTYPDIQPTVSQRKWTKNYITDMLNREGILQLVFLTKMDKECALVEKDFRNIFMSGKVERAVKEAADMFGLPSSHVLPVPGISNEKETALDDNMKILALEALYQALAFADDFLENQYEEE